MKRRNAHVLCGTVYATASVLCGLVIALLSVSLNSFVLCLAINGEIVFMIASIGFYLLSLSEMNQLLKALNKAGISKQDMKELREKVRSECGASVDGTAENED